MKYIMEKITKNNFYFLPNTFVLVLIMFISACNSTSSNSDTNSDSNNSEPIEIDTSNLVAKLAIPLKQQQDNYRVLFFGNSHIADIPKTVETIIEHTLPNATVTSQRGPGFDYLAERLDDNDAKALLVENEWSHVVFQAQKYSQSGAYTYPTVAAETWVKLAKSKEIQPIMFPEHPQRGKTKEAGRIHKIHVEIAQQEPTCVAPVGLAWDQVIEIAPHFVLHESDGNHASKLGRLLSALVIYQVITGESADLVPYIAELDFDIATQDLLGQVASSAIAQNPPCDY